jgi:hypothetical protein
MSTADSALHTINNISSVEDEGQLKQLDQALDTLFQSGEAEKGLDALFAVFERFPHSDGYGVFWSILHGLEALPNYEPRLVLSVRTQPMEFNLMMINRLLNAKVFSIGDVSLLVLLEEVANNHRYDEHTRLRASEYVNRHRDKR